jgi:hypothetical protein
MRPTSKPPSNPNFASNFRFVASTYGIFTSFLQEATTLIAYDDLGVFDAG